MFSPTTALSLRVTINAKHQCPIVGYVESEEGDVTAMYMDAHGSIHSLDELLPETKIVIEYRAPDGVWTAVI